MESPNWEEKNQLGEAKSTDACTNLCCGKMVLRIIEEKPVDDTVNSVGSVASGEDDEPRNANDRDEEELRDDENNPEEP